MYAWINRYIMECKLKNKVGFSVCAMRINRYIMECKFGWPMHI